MKEQISRRDWEKLSAYTDGQLSAEERTRIETRLKRDPILRQALDDLHLTRAAVKSLPHLQAPRNFTLTPKMAGRRERKFRALNLFSTFRLASVLSTVLLVLVVLGDFLGSGRVGMLPAQELAEQVAPAAPLELESAESIVADEAIEQPETLAKEIDAEGMGAEKVGTGEAEPVEIMPEAEAQPQAEAMADAEEPEEEAERAVEDDQADGAGESFAIQPTPLPIATPAEPASAPEEGLAYTPEVDSEIPQVVTASAPMSGIRIIELLLGVIAIISGLAAFYIHRRDRL